MILCLEKRPDNLRGYIRDPVFVPERLLYTRPDKIESKVGLSGQKITCEANYFRLTKQPNWSIYQYRVDFMPDVPCEKFRRYLVGTQREMLGGFLFDGTQIFLTKKLESELVDRVAHGKDDETPYTIRFNFTTVVNMSDVQSLQVLNLILRRAMDGLHLETVGRNKYDPAAAVSKFHYFLYLQIKSFMRLRIYRFACKICVLTFGQDTSHLFVNMKRTFWFVPRFHIKSCAPKRFSISCGAFAPKIVISKRLLKKIFWAQLCLPSTIIKLIELTRSPMMSSRPTHLRCVIQMFHIWITTRFVFVPNFNHIRINHASNFSFDNFYSKSTNWKFVMQINR